MGNQPKKSAGAKKRKQSAPAQPQTKAPQAEVEATASDSTDHVEAPEVEGREAAPRLTASDWYGQSAILFNVKPNILRMALAGHPEGRKYTEDEIRRLIQRKLGEPA